MLGYGVAGRGKCGHKVSVDGGNPFEEKRKRTSLRGQIVPACRNEKDGCGSSATLRQTSHPSPVGRAVKQKRWVDAIRSKREK